jgi:hypothetical protein
VPEISFAKAKKYRFHSHDFSGHATSIACHSNIETRHPKIGGVKREVLIEQAKIYDAHPETTDEQR